MLSNECLMHLSVCMCLCTWTTDSGFDSSLFQSRYSVHGTVNVLHKDIPVQIKQAEGKLIRHLQDHRTNTQFNNHNNGVTWSEEMSSLNLINPALNLWFLRKILLDDYMSLICNICTTNHVKLLVSNWPFAKPYGGSVCLEF